MAPFPELPEELTRLILDNLARDKYALLATSLVSKKLHRPSVHLLYTKIALLLDRPCALLLRTLSERPDLALCVYSVIVYRSKDDDNFFLALDQVLRHASELRTLTIRARCCEVLSQRPDIIELKCAKPCTRRSGATRWMRANMSAPLSPRAFSQALFPVWNSLQRLRLQITAGNQVWQGHDGTRLSCYGFCKLIDLDVSASFLFSDAAPTPARDGVYKLLPPSIISLRVEFDQHMGFLRHPVAIRNKTDAGLLHSTEPSTYFWLEEILTSASSTLCHLRHVDICERPIRSYGGYTNIDWKPSQHLENICLQSGIVLHASLRKWQPGRHWCRTR